MSSSPRCSCRAGPGQVRREAPHLLPAPHPPGPQVARASTLGWQSPGGAPQWDSGCLRPIRSPAVRQSPFNTDSRSPLPDSACHGLCCGRSRSISAARHMEGVGSRGIPSAHAPPVPAAIGQACPRCAPGLATILSPGQRLAQLESTSNRPVPAEPSCDADGHHGCWGGSPPPVTVYTRALDARGRALTTKSWALEQEHAEGRRADAEKKSRVSGEWVSVRGSRCTLVFYSRREGLADGRSVRAGKAALHDPGGEGNMRLRSSKEAPWLQQRGRGRRGDNEAAEATTCSWDPWLLPTEQR